MSVQVAVRVRPFNQREIELNTKLCVEMRGNRTTLKDLDDPDKDRDFYFDFSFWSFDGFRTLSDGINVPEDDFSIYADQQKVFNTLGKKILDNAWQGFHCSLFAYGQTGAGKSYSVMGYKPNVGIVPIACEEIFKRIDADKENITKTYEVTLGMLEIYNEKVQDLLIPVDKRPPQGMKIRESQSLGFYAEGLKKVPVRNFQEIEMRMEQGNSHRSVAATLMNANSSRAHTVIVIEFKQFFSEEGRKKERLSVINLVDLAGSEKVGKTGATGDRLKEASSINKSLSMLGNVITCLAEVEQGQKKKPPYRDSALTKLLANALGGNSKTVMICAVSPAFDNYEETLSTLRYADQAKKIKNRAEINESATDKLIRELKEENASLKKQLENLQLKFGGKIDPSNPLYKAYMDMSKHLEMNEKMINDSNKSAEEKLKDMESELEFEYVDTSKPYLANLNEDPQLDMKVLYTLDRKQTRIGRQKEENELEIILNGLGVKANHCQLVNEKGKITLIPGQEDNIYDFLFLNGEKIAGPIQVFHNDRIFVGTSAAFVVKFPDKKIREGNPKDEEINYIYAYNERKQKEEEERIREQEEIKRKMNMSMEERLAEMLASHKLKMEKLQKEIDDISGSYEQRIQSMIEGNKKEIEAEEQKMKELKRMTSMRVNGENDKKKHKFQANLQIALEKIQDLKEKRKLEKQIEEMLPKINEMNLMSEELGRDVRFVLKIVEDDADKLQVVVENKESNQTYIWDLEKALNRYYMVKEKYNQSNNPQNEVDGDENVAEKDPWEDQQALDCIGKCSIILQPLLYNIDNPTQSYLYDEEDKSVRGYIRLNIFKTDQIQIEEENFESNNLCRNKGDRIKDPMILKDKIFRMKINIEEFEIPPNIENIKLKYVLKDDENLEDKGYTVIPQSEEIIQNFSNTYVKLNFRAIHTYKGFTRDHIEYFEKKILTIKIYGQCTQSQGGVENYQGYKKRNIQSLIGQLDISNADNEKLQKKLEENKFRQKLEELEKRLQEIASKWWIPILFFTVVSMILFMIHIVLLTSYRASYDKMLSSKQQRLVTESKDNTGFWRAFSISLICCSVMIEFAQVSLFPFAIWTFSALVWLFTNTTYQNQQLQAQQQQQPGGVCEKTDSSNMFQYSCQMSKSFYNLYTFTVFVIIYNLIIYLFYYISLINAINGGFLNKYLKRGNIQIHPNNQKPKDEENDPIKNFNNTLLNDKYNI